MEVTSVKIQKVFSEPQKMLVAIASVIIDGMLVINDIRILKSAEKTFVGMPSRRIQDGLYKDIIHPINAEGRKIIEDAVLSTYAAYVADMATKEPEDTADKSENA